MQLWVCKWPLTVFIIVFPIVAFPLVMTGLLKAMPLESSTLAGAIFSLFSVMGLRIIQVAKTDGVKTVIVLLVLAALVGWLAGSLKIWGVF
jgi:hypothetical protein